MKKTIDKFFDGLVYGKHRKKCEKLSKLKSDYEKKIRSGKTEVSTTKHLVTDGIKFLVKKENEFYEANCEYEVSNMGGGDPLLDFTLINLIPTNKKVNLRDLKSLGEKSFENKSYLISPCGNPILSEAIGYGEEIKANYIVASDEAVGRGPERFTFCNASFYKKNLK